MTDTAPDAPVTRPYWLAASLAALGAVVLLLAAVNVAVSSAVIRDPALAQLLGLFVVWIPLVIATLAVARRHGSGSLAKDFGLRFTPLDVLWGAGVGLLCRAAASALEIAVYGTTSSGAVELGGPLAADRLSAWLVYAALAPLVLAPVIEELFFRGLLLRSLTGGEQRRAATLTTVVAITASAVTFALLHLVGASSVQSMVVLGGSTLLFGLVSGVLAVLTGRLGASIIAHATFNALVVLPDLIA